MADPEFLRQLTRKLADDGKLIEAGWIAMRVHAIHPDANPMQLKEMRIAFMAGAHHLLSSMLTTLDPEHEPTEADLRRISLIDAELKVFAEELKTLIAVRKRPNP